MEMKHAEKVIWPVQHDSGGNDEYRYWGLSTRKLQLWTDTQQFAFCRWHWSGCEVTWFRNEAIGEELEQQKNLVKMIWKSKPTWFRHISRMDDGKLTARPLYDQVEGKLSRGGQMKTWMDNMMEDLVTREVDMRTAINMVGDEAGTSCSNLIRSSTHTWRKRDREEKKTNVPSISLHYTFFPWRKWQSC